MRNYFFKFVHAHAQFVILIRLICALILHSNLVLCALEFDIW